MKPLRYFDRDLVLYRGEETGAAVVLDAHCPHLGAHLGYQLTSSPLDQPFPPVVGDNIRCPWHGWCFDPSGQNIKIPDSDRRHSGRALRAWPVREVNGWILVWHDQGGSLPSWDPPVLPRGDGGTATEDYYEPHPQAVRTWSNVSVLPRNAMENAFDIAHFKSVHRHVGDIVLEKASFGYPTFEAVVRTAVPTPRGPEACVFRSEGWGPGVTVTRFTGIHDIVDSTNITPISPTRSDLFVTLWIRRTAQTEANPRLVEGLIQGAFRQYERDLVIWEHRSSGGLAGVDPAEAALLEQGSVWASQFLP